MSFLSELIAFIVVGDARYGREETPLDRMKEQAELGLSIVEDDKRHKSKTSFKRY